MAVPSQNIKALFIGRICALLWGGYDVSRARYYLISWDETEGAVVDFERHVMTCEKGVGECYSILVGNHAGNDYFVTNDNKTFSRDKPIHLLEKKVVVYYSPENPGEAILGGEYGPFRNGATVIFIGVFVLFLSWLVHNRQ
ncbi:MAG: hypothetical protein ACI9XC_000770 [Gammaproteobacteria bacterium]|jgi:hypothetical protein